MEMLSNAGFIFKKWDSNSNDLSKSIDPDFRLSNGSFLLYNGEMIKTLGVHYKTVSDAFFFKANNA